MKEGFTNSMVENKKRLSRDAIKYIAIVAMLANHIATFVVEFPTLETKT
jgi:hypothetical protein